jgi:GNAT superfamily N-acetyltransferase
MPAHPPDAVRTPASLRRLRPSETGLLRDHLLRLDPESRLLRFGSPVNDGFIETYVSAARRSGTLVEGAFVDGILRAAAELRPLPGSGPLSAEAAFSVEKSHQGHGLGDLLMKRLIVMAQNRGVRLLYMVCLKENLRMRRLAAKHSAELTILESEVEARVRRTWPTLFSLANEMLWQTEPFVTALFDWTARDGRSVEQP